MRAKLGS